MGTVRVGTIRARRPAGMQTRSTREVKKKLKHLREVEREGYDRGENISHQYVSHLLGMEVT